MGFCRSARLSEVESNALKYSPLARAILDAQSTRHGARPGPKLACRSLPTGLLLAPQPEARERPFAAA